MQSIAQLAQQLASGQTTSQALVEAVLDRIDAHRKADGAAFISVDVDAAKAAARASDRDRAAGRVPSLLAGLPVSIKDLFDVKGQVTRAGSILLDTAMPAKADAIAVSRLRAAGAILLGRTNMSEFAFSGLGLNPHYGTPRVRQAPSRVAGGSSSGAAVSVVEGMAVAGLGTDTGGSVRIPSAFCGLTGFKPTASRVPLDGAFPLAQSLDSIGPLAHSVEDCWIIDGILAGTHLQTPALPLAGLNLAITRDYVLEDIDDATARAFQKSVQRLTAAGAHVTWIDFPELYQLPEINDAGGFTAAEAWYHHRYWLEGDRRHLYDPLVAYRIKRGKSLSAFDYLQLIEWRQQLIGAAQQRLGHFHAWLMPTVAIVAPRISALQENTATFFSTNGLVLRNPSVVNFLDGCALSLPCHAPGDLPVGLSVVGLHRRDAQVLAVSKSIEKCLATMRGG
ncbi:amidase, Asp-tRNAAsn/Glu-tRNAGln amidotransferase A subunit [Pseudomonas sp. GM49]|uniref:amidase n=1 Tax=Pseudomonas sp. GM49 TaxID=1144331 RepID=UPI00026FDC18|nr:amidase [Pseudomonas sp. GM49]EJM67408.1 amidase, Asp-tRNAAsn/Glu-tRNAGln amidotransferase A subunit [Pseudomonas sp. GM49]